MSNFGVEGSLRIGDTGNTPINDVKVVSLAVDPANQAGAGTFKTALAFPAGTFSALAILVADPPSDLEANLAVGGVIVTGADAASLTLHALAAIDGASKTWRFLVLEPAS